MLSARKPQIHLWVFNHPINGISDQVDFFLLTMRQKGFSVTLSRRPRLDALNVVIENFSENNVKVLTKFCTENGKRVAIIMTEHLDLIGSQLFIHGDPLGTENDYMHPATQFARIKNLMAIVPYIRTIFVLGDLPKLDGADIVFPGIPVRRIPFPELKKVDIKEHDTSYDFVFSGKLTEFRNQILGCLDDQYTLVSNDNFVARKKRDSLILSARVVLNIPQRADWRWLSLMRIIASLSVGRVTVSILTKDTSCISRCCIQLENADWLASLGNILNNWREMYDAAFVDYEAMRQEFLLREGFPDDLFEYWSWLEN